MNIFNPFASPPSISAQELKEKLASNFDGILVDVREAWEYDIAHIDEAKLMPINNFQEHISELEAAGKDCEILLICQSGARSAYIQKFLIQQGFTNTFNISRGMDAWLRL